jgi:hypothetical protein
MEKNMDITRRSEKVIRNIRKKALNLISSDITVIPLQLIRVTEKFDIVDRPPFRGGFVIHDKD